MLARLSDVSQIRWVGVKNTGTDTIPAFGLMNVTGVDTATGLVQIDGPPKTDNQEVLFCGDIPIPPLYSGIGTRDFPVYALYDTSAGTPNVLEQWGSAANSFMLKKGNSGFTIYGGATQGRVKIVPVLAGAAMAASLTVKKSDGSVIVTNVNTILLNLPADWSLLQISSGMAQISTTGLTGSIMVCEGDGNIHSFSFSDGLLKGTT